MITSANYGLNTTGDSNLSLGRPAGRVDLLAGAVSPLDAQYLREIVAAFGLLDAVIPHLETLPIGATLSDRFFDVLRELSGRSIPDIFRREREQFVEAIVAAYDRLVGRRVVVYGEPDMVVGLAAMLADAGMVPVLCATAGRSARLRENIAAVEPQLMTQMALLEDAGIAEVDSHARALKPDLFVGNARVYGLSQSLGVPLVLAGWPLDSRFIGARLLHVGYRGGLQLLSRIRSVL